MLRGRKDTSAIQRSALKILNFCQYEFFGDKRRKTRHGKHIKQLKQVLIYVRFCYKGKAIPLQAWTAPEGSRRLRLPDFKIIGT